MTVQCLECCIHSQVIKNVALMLLPRCYIGISKAELILQVKQWRWVSVGEIGPEVTIFIKLRSEIGRLLCPQVRSNS